jgi:DNA polymerase I
VIPDYADPNALYIVDLSAFVHKFWHVGPNFAARNFAGMIAKLVGTRGPARMVLAEDTVWPTFRHDLMSGRGAGYKGTRPEVPAAERASKLEQLRLAAEYVEKAHGMMRLWAKGFEADDVIATLAQWGLEEGLRVVVLGHDKDLLQLVGPSCVLWDGKGAATGPAEVHEKFGVTPAQIVDYLSIVGDTTDNVAGIRGIGEKGAVQILGRFGRLDVALHEANETGPDRGANHPFFKGKPSLWAKLVASKPEADFARELVCLRRDVPLPILSLDELGLSTPAET